MYSAISTGRNRNCLVAHIVFRDRSLTSVRRDRRQITSDVFVALFVRRRSYRCCSQCIVLAYFIVGLRWVQVRDKSRKTKPEIDCCGIENDKLMIYRDVIVMKRGNDLRVYHSVATRCSSKILFVSDNIWLNLLTDNQDASFLAFL